MTTVELYHLRIIYFYVTLLSELVGTSPLFLCQHVQQSSTNGSFVASLGCDDDKETFSLTIDGVNEVWSVDLNNTLTIGWIYVSVGTGHYEVHVTDGNLRTSTPTLCQNFSFTGPNSLKKNNKVLECSTEMTGDTIVMTRTDFGPLRLFDLYPIICPENHYGPNCTKCKAECIPCSPITGVCLNSMCDQKTGRCEDWKTEMVTYSTASDEDTPSTKEMNVIQGIL
ncbi:uncharacterized protein LOC130048660 [Ostrea edulis]|uniref:uncharacterized protein LOC130048660 n=1 Tax=Ostrea edulis TaxID=37623 RepID=UPI0024AF5A06|nr:uncharacterized protein LOC130048660 [Ostrea edulis]